MSEQGSPSPAADAPAPAAPSDPSPIPPAPTPAERAKEPTPRASIDRAFAKAGVDAEPSRAPEPIQSTTEAVPETKPAPEAKEAAKAERSRGPNGQFLPTAQEAKAEGATKPVTPSADAKAADKPAEKPNGHFAEPPPRFSPDAKTAWKDAPEPVRAEVHRAFREMEQGIAKYRDDATAFNELREHDALAKQHGTSIKQTMDQYIRLSQALQSQNPMPAIQELLRHAGLTVQEFVAHVSGQQPEDASASSAREIMELRNQVGQLQQQLQGELGQVKSTLQQQQQQGLLGEIQQFAQDKPRFDELSMEIAAQVRAGYNLDEAYVRAERLNPLPAAPPPPAAAQNGEKPDPVVQPRGSLSVTGAPAAGSDPRNRGSSPTTRAALDKSWALLGLPQ